MSENWLKLSNKELTSEFNIKENIEEGDKGGYNTSKVYNVINGETYMNEKDYKKGEKTMKDKERFIKNSDMPEFYRWLIEDVGFKVVNEDERKRNR